MLIQLLLVILALTLKVFYQLVLVLILFVSFSLLLLEALLTGIFYLSTVHLQVRFDFIEFVI